MAVEPFESPRAAGGPAPVPEGDTALAALGLGRLAELVYRTLLAHGPAAPARLADLAHTNLATVTAALDDLAALDLARPEPVGPTAPQRCWSAASPELAPPALVARRHESLLG